MSQDKDRQRSVHERVERLRVRLRAAGDNPRAVAAVLHAVLDLLADEL